VTVVDTVGWDVLPLERLVETAELAAAVERLMTAEACGNDYE